MEHIRNSKPSTTDSSNQTINISSDIEKEPKPEPEIDPEEVDDLVRQFKSEANQRLHSLTQDCINYVNPIESDAIQDEFRRWINSCSQELRELYYKAAQKRFHDNHSGIIKPLLEMFTQKLPPTPEAEIET